MYDLPKRDRDQFVAILCVATHAGTASHLSNSQMATRHAGSLRIGDLKAMPGLMNALFRVCLLALLLSAIASSAALAAARAYMPNSGDGSISVIDTSTRAVIATIPTDSVASGIAISSDGLRVYVANVRGLLVIDAATNKPVGQLDSPFSRAAAVSADGTAVYLSGDSGFAAYDSTTLSFINGVSTVGANNITLSPDGTRAYLSYPNFALVAVNLNTWAPGSPWSWTDCLHPVDAAVSPDGSSLRITCEMPSTFVTVNLATLMITDMLPLQSDPSELAVSSDGSLAYIATPAANAVVVVDTSGTPAVLDTISVGAAPSSLSLTKEGDQLYVSNTLDNTVSVIDTATRNVIDTIAVGPAPRVHGDFIGPNEFLLLNGFE